MELLEEGKFESDKIASQINSDKCQFYIQGGQQAFQSKALIWEMSCKFWQIVIPYTPMDLSQSRPLAQQSGAGYAT